METTKQKLVVGIGLVILLVVSLIVSFGPNFVQQVKAGAGFNPATMATSSNPSVTTTAKLVFASSTCSARIISTGVGGIMITFSDVQGAVPSGTIGHWQAASTTVAYDAGLYGCDAVRIYSSASQSINVSESR